MNMQMNDSPNQKLTVQNLIDRIVIGNETHNSIIVKQLSLNLIFIVLHALQRHEFCLPGNYEYIFKL